MLEFRPALQIVVHESKPTLYDMLSGRRFVIEDDEFLGLLSVAFNLTPCDKNELSLRLALKARVSLIRAKEVIESLCANGILCDSSLIVSEKAAVQSWVDHGWIDAFVLHFSSRNLTYADDPFEFGGREDVSFPTPNREPLIPTPISSSQAIKLREPSGTIPSEEILDAIKRRRSFLPFSREHLELGDVDEILWHANSLDRERSAARDAAGTSATIFDSAFSCLFSFVILFEEVAAPDRAIPPGIYAYEVKDHALRCIKEGNFRADVQRAASGQKRAASGLFAIVIATDWAAYAKVYAHERSYRNILINVGELAQYYLVWATHKGFNTFMSPAISDEAMTKLLEASGKEPIYLVAAG